MILSLEPVKSNFPSWEKSTVLTGAVWALTVCEDPFLKIFMKKIKIIYTLLVHSLTVSSLEAEAIVFPLGDIAKSRIAPLWPMNLYGLIWGLKFQTITFPSSLPEITCFLYFKKY